MATSRETVDFILDKLDNPEVFRARAMFGEYALYANNKVVALICDDILYVKVMATSVGLEKVCEKDSPYPKAKLHYVVGEDQIENIPNLANILILIAKGRV